MGNNIESFNAVEGGNSSEFPPTEEKENNEGQHSRTRLETLTLLASHKATEKEFLESLPESDIESKFSVGSEVVAPISPDNQEMEVWKIVKAEKGSYIIERPSEKEGLFNHAIFTEEELAQFGNNEQEILDKFQKEYESMSLEEKAQQKALSLPTKYKLVAGHILGTPSDTREIIHGLSDEKFLEINENELDELNAMLKKIPSRYDHDE